MLFGWMFFRVNGRGVIRITASFLNCLVRFDLEDTRDMFDDTEGVRLCWILGFVPP